MYGAHPIWPIWSRKCGCFTYHAQFITTYSLIERTLLRLVVCICDRRSQLTEINAQKAQCHYDEQNLSSRRKMMMTLWLSSISPNTFKWHNHINYCFIHENTFFCLLSFIPFSALLLMYWTLFILCDFHCKSLTSRIWISAWIIHGPSIQVLYF